MGEGSFHYGNWKYFTHKEEEHMKKTILFLVIGILLLPVVIQRRATAVSSALTVVETPHFSYAATYGTLEEPYIVDSDHFNHPYGIALDSSANLWVGEWDGARATKFNSSGTHLMTLGQTGIRIADETRDIFSSVVEIAIGVPNIFGQSEVWLVDAESHRVVNFDSAGTYQFQIGVTWEGGTDDNHFNSPRGAATDSTGNLYVSDSFNNRIQVFDSSGTYLATLGETAVSGTDNTHFNSPRHIHIDNNLLYVADSANHRVQIFNVANPLAITHVATLGTTAVSGTDTTHFDFPMGVATNSSHIFVIDTNNGRAQIFDKATYAYTTSFALPTTSGFYADIAVGGLSSTIYVADNNNRVLVYDGNLNLIDTMGSANAPYLTDSQHYNFPRGVSATADGGVVVVEENGHRLIKLDASGAQAWTVGAAGVAGEGNDQFHNPMGTAVAANGDIYVADAWNNRIQIFTSAGIYKATVGGAWGSANGELDWPTDVAVAANGDIYIADVNNNRIQHYSGSGTYIDTIGTTGVSGTDNAHFGYPQGVAIDSTGQIFVADDSNSRIQVYESSHAMGHAFVRTIGNTGVCSGRLIWFCGPHSLNVDSQDRLYIADTWNNRVQIMAGDGTYLNTLGGSWGGGSGEMRGPKGVAVTSNGIVFVADTENMRIQKFMPVTRGGQQVNVNGFGDGRNKQIPSLAVFGSDLYAGTWFNDNGTESSQLWRSSDGQTWSKVGEGFGNGASHLAEFDGYFYLGTWNGAVWRSSNGSDWTQVVNDAFGDVDNGIARFTVFNNMIYAGTWNRTTGAQIWRSSNGTSWTQLGTSGLGDANNTGAIGSAVFGGNLYFGIFNEVTGAQLWRTDGGSGLTAVVNDGFGNSNNSAISGLAVFDNMLYASVRNTGEGAEIWRSSDGTIWNQVASGGFGDSNTGHSSALEPLNGKLYLVVDNEVTGMEIWQTSNGSDWQKIGAAGFGDSNNQTFYDSATAVFQNKLFIATNNYANGGEIWQLMNEVYLPMIIR